jgi:hypothetical protein
MADAPPRPNLFFDFAILTCLIIIWTLLLISPSVFASLLKCQKRSGGTLLHQQLQPLTPRRHHPSKKRGSSDDLNHFNTYSMVQNNVQSPGLLLLGLSTGWDVTLNQLSFEPKKQHISVTSATAPDAVFEQLHSKACIRAATLPRCVLTQTHISWVWMVTHRTEWQIVQTSSTETSSLLRETTKLTE